MFANFNFFSNLLIIFLSLMLNKHLFGSSFITI